MTRLPNDTEIAGMEVRPSSSSSRSGSRSGPASVSPSALKACLVPLLAEDTSQPSAARRSLGSDRQNVQASLAKLPGNASLEESSGGAGGLRERREKMKLGAVGGLKIDTHSKAAVKEPTFRLLAGGDDSVEKYYDFGDEIYDGGPRSRVMKAFRRSDRKEVVIKVRAKKPDKSNERAWREVMTQLHNMRTSQYVLEVYEILEDDRAFFVVMPMCEGGELFNFLVTEAEVPESECKRIIREILHAIGHLHDNNLIHRDVKPENIMFDIDHDPASPKSVKLIDFDTCMEWTPMTPKNKQFVGTPGYIAPEALLGDACPQSDLWSVGVICYILMTGETPWTEIETLEDGTVGSLGAKKMYQALKTAVIDWESEPWPDFPLARDLCQKLMAFDTEERPEHVSEALAHPWLSG